MLPGLQVQVNVRHIVGGAEGRVCLTALAVHRRVTAVAGDYDAVAVDPLKDTPLDQHVLHARDVHGPNPRNGPIT